MNMLFDMIVPVAWAATGGEGHHAPSITGLLFPLINFLIFAYLAKRYAIPPIKEHLRKRRENIINSIADANEAKSQAEKYLDTYKNLVKNLAGECEKIREGLRAEAEREKALVIADAEEFVAKLKADADFLGEQEMKMARQGIRAELANLAESNAERVITGSLTDADQDRLITEFAQELTHDRTGSC